MQVCVTVHVVCACVHVCIHTGVCDCVQVMCVCVFADVSLNV